MIVPELRWALIGLGVAFLAGLALWEWRRSRRQPARTTLTDLPTVAEQPERPRRVEPGFDGIITARSAGPDESIEVPTIHPVEPVPVASGVAVDVPAAARAPARAAPVAPAVIRWPPEHSERVLSLRVVSRSGEPLPGRQLRNALESAGLVPGPQTIYHRVAEDGAVLVSVANLVRPGSLDPAQMDAQQFRGLSLFSILPGPVPPEAMLDGLVDVARTLARRFDALVQDDQGAALDAARLQALRDSLDGSAGAGTTP